jgi:hypothetical protein
LKTDDAAAALLTEIPEERGANLEIPPQIL